MKKYSIALFLFALTTFFAQVAILAVKIQQREEVMADTLRKDGKIYILVSVIIIILAGIFTYLLMLDDKVSKIENKLKK